MPMPSGGNPSYPYPSHGYAQPTIPQDVYRDSIQSAVLDKVRSRLDDTIQVSNAEVASLKRTEQDLIQGEKKNSILNY